MKKKKEKILLIIWTISLAITISGLTVTFFKFENNKKKFNEELINNDLCSRKTFSGQLEYLANEQAVFYNLDSNNIYKDIIDTSQNKFKEYMETKGWEYDIERSADYLSQIIEVKFMKNDVTVSFMAQEELGIERYYYFSALFLEDSKGDFLFQHNQEDEEILDIKAKDLEKIDLNYYKYDNEKQNVLIEKILKEFITDVQNYSEEICSSSSEDRLEI